MGATTKDCNLASSTSDDSGLAPASASSTLTSLASSVSGNEIVPLRPADASNLCTNARVSSLRSRKTSVTSTSPSDNTACAAAILASGLTVVATSTTDLSVGASVSDARIIDVKFKIVL